MNHTCECGHRPSEHYGDTGPCEFDVFNDGFDPCNCPRYQWQGDQ